MSTRSLLALATVVFLACGQACGPNAQPAEAPTPTGRTGETKVTVTKIDPNLVESEPSSASTEIVGPIGPAKPLDPAPQPTATPATSLVGGAATEWPLPLPTAVATSRTHVFAFARTRAGWIVRAQSTKVKSPTWSAPAVVATAFDDDAPPFAINDGEIAWFGVSSTAGGTRVVRVDAPQPSTGSAAAPRITPIANAPSKLGRVASFVPLKAHVAVLGRDGDAITFARLHRVNGFLDTAARVIARGRPSATTTASRSPRATNEEDKVLLAWDADDVPDAKEAPGTTAAERAAPKPGIYVRRFFPSGEPASPARRLTRPSFEAHALDVVVELGACAVLASTHEGFEMFRFVRKGDNLDPYGGGLFLAPPGGDVALGADVIGTIGLTSTKLLRIGPGIKIVPTPLGFSPPAGGSFDEVRVVMDGYGAHALLSTRTSLGPLPTIARIDGEHMGPVLPTPWIGPPPQRLAFADVDGDEGLAIVVDAGATHALRLGLDGNVKDRAALPIDPKQIGLLDWSRAPLPRAARAAGEWVLALRDGRALIATGPRAGAFVALGPPKGAQPSGLVGLMQSGGRSSTVRAVYVPPVDRAARLWTTTLDPKQGTVATWTSIAGSERNYGALGGARFVALPRASGGLWLLTNSGPKVSSVAQLFGLVLVDADGQLTDEDIDAPAPVQDITLVATMSGPAIVATLTGKGVATRWLDGPTKGWRESFDYTPFRVRGDGPIVRDKGVPLVFPSGALPFALTGDAASFLGDRCPFVMVTGKRSLLLACEEGSGSAPLAARATTRVLRF
ncbi:MAG: hypothetical protein HYV09_25835 [Deltaproteobacteria bacterium]|nr:hypothetical protein [Deltaproteobacteria bacterium]